MNHTPTPAQINLTRTALASALSALLDGMHTADGNPVTAHEAVTELFYLDAVAQRVTVGDEPRFEEWAQTPNRLAAIAHQHRREVEPRTAGDLPCPDWCDREAGHPFETWPNSYRRTHVHRFGDRAVVVAVEQHERTPEPGSKLTDIGLDPEAAIIALHNENGTGYLTAAGARRLADQLTQAADLLDDVLQ